MNTHVIIPDTQVKPGVPTEHLDWIGRFIVDRFAGRDNVTIIHLGDHWDMESLSSYDRGTKSMEGRRYQADIQVGNEAFGVLNRPIAWYNARQAQNKQRLWTPRKVFLFGNHEDRIARAAEHDAQLDGLLSLDDCDTLDWERVPFLTPVTIDGVAYCHYFQNPMSGRPHGGVASTRLKTIGYSFVMGHQQTFDYAQRYVRGLDGEPLAQHGLIVGACYLHDETYKGVQGNPHYRGIVVLNNVENGDYALEQIRLSDLRRVYGEEV